MPKCIIYKAGVYLVEKQLYHFQLYKLKYYCLLTLNVSNVNNIYVELNVKFNTLAFD